MNSYDALMKALEAWDNSVTTNVGESKVKYLRVMIHAYRAHREAEGIWLEKPQGVPESTEATLSVQVADLTAERDRYRAALQAIKKLVVGDKIPNRHGVVATTVTRNLIADYCDKALEPEQ